MIKKWRRLKVGQCVRLSCGCEGVVKSVHPKGKEFERGFWVTYTIMGCKDKRSHEESYKKGYGPFGNFFNSGLADEAMPAEEIPLPSWVHELPLKYREAFKLDERENK